MAIATSKSTRTARRCSTSYENSVACAVTFKGELPSGESPAGSVPSLRLIGSAPRVLSQLAEELQVDLSVASRQVAGLHAAGYVKRIPDPRDGRSQNLELTGAGKRALRKAQERSAEVLDRATERWTEAEIREPRGRS